MNIHDYALEKLSSKNTRLTDALVNQFKDSKKILNLSNDEIVKILSQTRINDDSIIRFLKNKEIFKKDPKKYISECNLEIEKIKKTFGVEIISFSDKEYPEQLKKIKEVPLILYVKGKLNFEYDKSIAIVGTRKTTTYAKRKIREITSDLSKDGYCIISGLAIGTDTEAHTSAVISGGKTIAVLPYINGIYPPANEPLARDILNSGGALISENCFFTRYYHASLLTQRNRIISGLSKSVFIVEGSEKSGSFSQYNHAKRQNKIIFSLKPMEKHEGDYLPRLIFAKEGNWIESSKDIISLLNRRKEKQKDIYL